MLEIAIVNITERRGGGATTALVVRFSASVGGGGDAVGRCRFGCAACSARRAPRKVLFVAPSRRDCLDSRLLRQLQPVCRGELSQRALQLHSHFRYPRRPLLLRENRFQPLVKQRGRPFVLRERVEGNGAGGKLHQDIPEDAGEPIVLAIFNVLHECGRWEHYQVVAVALPAWRCVQILGIVGHVRVVTQERAPGRFGHSKRALQRTQHHQAVVGTGPVPTPRRSEGRSPAFYLGLSTQGEAPEALGWLI